MLRTRLIPGASNRAVSSGAGGSWYDSAQIARVSSRGNNGAGCGPPATVSGGRPIELLVRAGEPRLEILYGAHLGHYCQELAPVN